jgi:hypothetical protein
LSRLPSFQLAPDPETHQAEMQEYLMKLTSISSTRAAISEFLGVSASWFSDTKADPLAPKPAAPQQSQDYKTATGLRVIGRVNKIEEKKGNTDEGNVIEGLSYVFTLFVCMCGCGCFEFTYIVLLSHCSVCTKQQTKTGNV